MKYDVNFWGPVSTTIGSIITTIALLYSMYQNHKNNRIKFKIKERVLLYESGRERHIKIKSSVTNLSGVSLKITEVGFYINTDEGCFQIGPNNYRTVLNPKETLNDFNSIKFLLNAEIDVHILNWGSYAKTESGMYFNSKPEKEYTISKFKKVNEEITAE